MSRVYDAMDSVYHAGDANDRGLPFEVNYPGRFIHNTIDKIEDTINGLTSYLLLKMILDIIRCLTSIKRVYLSDEYCSFRERLYDPEYVITAPEYAMVRGIQADMQCIFTILMNAYRKAQLKKRALDTYQTIVDTTELFERSQ